MSLAIIDAREWQRMFDLRSGDRVQADAPLVRMVAAAMRRHPFPGDLDAGSNRWVTDAALDLIREYAPGFVYLDYARQYYLARYQPMSPAQRAALIADTAAEIERFLEHSGYAAVLVGTGDLTGFRGAIDVTHLDGLALATHWSARYAGLHAPSPGDLRRLAAEPLLERIVARRKLLELFQGRADQAARVPDYLLVAKEGHTFRTLGQSHRGLARIPAGSARCIPVSTHLGRTTDITGIRALVSASLERRRTALILVEGIGLEEFPWPCEAAANGREWFFYEPGEAQSLSIVSGSHRCFDYPTGYKAFEESMENREFPLSGYFTGVPEGTLGQGYAGRSLAVGNRSIYTHMVPGADIALECFARNLYNQGTMAVIHRQDK